MLGVKPWSRSWSGKALVITAPTNCPTAAPASAFMVSDCFPSAGSHAGGGAMTLMVPCGNDAVPFSLSGWLCVLFAMPVTESALVCTPYNGDVTGVRPGNCAFESPATASWVVAADTHVPVVWAAFTADCRTRSHPGRNAASRSPCARPTVALHPHRGQTARMSRHAMAKKLFRNPLSPAGKGRHRMRFTIGISRRSGLRMLRRMYDEKTPGDPVLYLGYTASWAVSVIQITFTRKGKNHF